VTPTNTATEPPPPTKEPAKLYLLSPLPNVHALRVSELLALALKNVILTSVSTACVLLLLWVETALEAENVIKEVYAVIKFVKQ